MCVPVSLPVRVYVCVQVCVKAATHWEGLTQSDCAQGPPLAQEWEGWAWKVERAWLASAAFSKTGVQMLAQLDGEQ